MHFQLWMQFTVVNVAWTSCGVYFRNIGWDGSIHLYIHVQSGSLWKFNFFNDFYLSIERDFVDSEDNEYYAY